MLKRLEKRQIVESTRRKEGQRNIRYYYVTVDGQTSLRKWLEPRFVECDLLTNDPLRTRMLYLKRLPKSRRAKWFASVEQALNEKLVEIKMQFSRIDSSANDSIFKELAIENAIVAFQARLKWLDRAKTRLKLEGLI